MSYDPNIHVATNKPLGIGQAIPTDARSYFYQSDIATYRPYQDTTEVTDYLNSDASRTGQFSIYINDGTLDEGTGEFTGGTITEWWFKDGVTDGDLVEKTSGGGGGTINGGTEIFSGDGAILSFDIPHGLGVTPVNYTVTSASTAAQGIAYAEVDSTNITVHYNIAPPTGVDNVSIAWTAS